MMSKKVKRISACFFLFTFFLLQVSALHALTHKHDLHSIENCTLCHVSLANQLTPTLGSDTAYEIPQFLVQSDSTVLDYYRSIFSDKLSICSLYNKPPPFLYSTP